MLFALARKAHHSKHKARDARARAMRAAPCTANVGTPHLSLHDSRASRTRNRRHVWRRSAVASGDDESSDLLVQWATADGLVLSPKVTVAAPFTGAPRGLVAVEDIDKGETVITLSTSCTAFDASAARADTDLGLGNAIEAYESVDCNQRGPNVSEETALALFVALARRHPQVTPFGAYCFALPGNLPSSPLFLDDDTFRAILPNVPLSLIEAADDARVDLYLGWDVAAAVVDLLINNETEENEPKLSLEEWTWAWSSVRSRAITFRVASNSGEDTENNEDENASKISSIANRCMVPVVDMMNHECEATTGDALGENSYPGPAVKEITKKNAVEWVTTRDIKKSQEVTWTYGADLSNEHLWLHYGFVPDVPVHKGTCVQFSFPEMALLEGIKAVAKSDTCDISTKRFEVLRKAGVGCGEKNEYENENGNDSRALQFTVTVNTPPNALAGIAGIACCDSNEIESLYERTVNIGDGTGENTEPQKPFSFSPESRRRAGRYVAFLLGHIQSTAVGEDIADRQGSSRGSSELEEAFVFAKRSRDGAVSVFLSIEPMLANESLLENGEWIDDAVEAALG